MSYWVKEQLGQGAAGESEKQHEGVGVDVYSGLVLCYMCFWCGLAWLACLPARVIYVSLWWNVGWGEVGLRDGLCFATRRCTCQVVREGHRTHQATILLEVSFLFIQLARLSLV